MLRSRGTRVALWSVGCLIASGATLGPAVAAARGPAPYIVVLKDRTQDSGVVARSHEGRHKVKPRSIYRHALKGYAATIPSTRVHKLRQDPRVEYVERDGTMRESGQSLPWGIDKIDTDRSSTFAGNGWGAVNNAHAFVVDSGIYRHSDLNVVNRINFAGGPSDDCRGHGTHVAGTLAARDNAATVVGAAPGTRLTAVKVLDCEGSGSKSDIIAGVDYVTARARGTSGPDVATMSLSGDPSRAIDDSVRRSAASGVFYAVAAGNGGSYACRRSPARAGAGTNNGIATVASTDPSDEEAPSSNYGVCVDIWAPGVRVASTRAGGGITTKSGTSMAVPHVAGTGALFRSRHAVTPSYVERKLKSSATVPGTKSKDGRYIRRLFAGGRAGF